MKKISVFALFLLLIGQTILSPFAMVSAATNSTASPLTVEEVAVKQADQALQTMTVQTGETLQLVYRLTVQEGADGDHSLQFSLPAGVTSSATGVFGEVGTYAVAGSNVTITMNEKVERTTTEVISVPVTVQSTFAFANESYEVTTTALEESVNQGETIDERSTVEDTAEETTDANSANEVLPKPHPTENDPSTTTNAPTTEDGEKQTGEKDETIQLDNTVPIQEIQSLERATGSYEQKMDLGVITDVEFEVNDVTNPPSPVKVRNGDTAKFKFNLSLAAPHNYGPGTTLTYTLPNIFEGVEFPNGTKFGDIGTLSNNGNDIIVTFNDAIRDEINQGLPIEPGSYFWVSASFSASNENLEETISLPGNEDIQLEFQPKGGSTIQKTGTPNNEGKNSDSITWVVDVNTNLANATNLARFKDELDERLTFIKDSVKVQELNVSLNGNLKVGNDATIQPIFQGQTMEIQLPDPKKAYRITYQTAINSSVNVEVAEEIFTNNASYNGKTDSAEVKVKYGTPLSKKGKLTDDLTADWTIQYNFNHRKIRQEDAILTDTWVTEGGSGGGSLQMVDHSFKVLEADGKTEVDASMYTMIPKTSGFELKFNRDVEKPYVIQYKTKPENLFATTSIKVTNTVKRKDIETPVVNTDVRYSKTQLMLSKYDHAIDYEKKEISWVISANQAGYPLPAQTVFEDRFKEKDMTIIEDSLIIWRGQSILEKDKYALINEGKEGFSIVLEEPTEERIIIEYKTSYEIKDVGSNERKYPNKITMKKTNLGYDPIAEDDVKINDFQKQNGYKNGVYNYETKKFHWEVGLNFNLNTLSNALFEDELPSSQKIEDVFIQKMKLTPDGKFVEDGEQRKVENEATEPHKIKVTFGKIDSPYRVNYTSVDADRIFPETEGNVQVKNKATLTSDAGENASWEKEVTVAHTEKKIKKNGKGVHHTERIQWDLKLNYGQSKLANAVVRDEVGKDEDGAPNQIILEDTFKVYEVKLIGEMDRGTPQEEKSLVDSSLYTLDVDTQKGTFTINFKETIEKAYFIQYETIFLGVSGSNVENNVTLTYQGMDGDARKDAFVIRNFQFDNAGTTIKVPFKVIKTDKETKQALEGVEFTLFNKRMPSIPLISGTTNPQGVWDIEMKIAEGDYILKETPLPGYKNLGDIEFTLHRDNIEKDGEYQGYQLVYVENEKLNLTFKAQKVDESGKSLQGAVFKLQTADGQDVPDYGLLTSNEEGWIVGTTSLEPGDYQLVEVTAPRGYQKLTEPIPFTIEKNQTEAKELPLIVNKLTQGVTLLKYHADKGVVDSTKPLQGAKFYLYAKGDNEQFAAIVDDEGQPIVYTTNAAGEIVIDVLEAGTYYFEEIEAPVGYDRSTEPIRFTLPNTTTEPLILTVGNERTPTLPTGSLTVTKVDADNSSIVLAGARFELANVNRQVVQTGETNEQGMIVFNALPLGQYVLKEVQSPNGYDLNSELFEVTIEQVTLHQALQVTNKKAQVTPPTDPNEPEEEPSSPGGGGSSPSNPDEPDEEKPSKPQDPSDKERPTTPKDSEKEKPSDVERPTSPETPTGEETPAVPENSNGEQDPMNPSDVADPMLPNEQPDVVETDNGGHLPSTGEKDPTTVSDKDGGQVAAGKGQQSPSGKVGNQVGTQQDVLPQTGEEKLILMMILGGLLILAGGYMIVKNTRKRV